MANVYRLYIFETLVREGGSMAINSLWSCISSRFAQNTEFIQIIGQNASDFEMFLRSNSALFNVDGFTVNLADDDNANDFCIPEKSTRYRMEYRDLQSNDMNYEAEAVKYFQTFLSKRYGSWTLIKTLFAYLVQAPMRIRIGLGTKNELISFLYRYPRIFKVSGENVTLTEDAASSILLQQTPVQLRVKKRVSINPKERATSMRIPMGAINPYRLSTIYNDEVSSPIPTQTQATPTGRPLSMIERTPITEPVINAYTGKKSNIISLTIPEFKTVSWLRNAVKTNFLPISHVMRRLIEAPGTIHSTVGTTQVEFIEFVNKHPTLATVDGDMVQFKPTERIHLIIVESQAQDVNNGVSLNGKKGCVFCVSKLWGIIDLGYHEHVFFDRSLFKNVTDLQKHFKVGELLYFNAVLAAKESRAKWRATRVWKESDILATRLAIKSNPNSKMPLFGDIVQQQNECLLEAGKRSSNMLIDPLVLKQSPELSCSLAIDGVNLAEAITSFASVRLAAPWEVSAIIAQSSELFTVEAMKKPLLEVDLRRKPLVEVHNRSNGKASQADSGLEGRASSSDSSNSTDMSSGPNELSKLVLKMNVDAEPVVPTDWLRRKSSIDKNKLNKSQLLICAEQGSQTENYQIST